MSLSDVRERAERAGLLQQQGSLSNQAFLAQQIPMNTSSNVIWSPTTTSSTYTSAAAING